MNAEKKTPEKEGVAEAKPKRAPRKTTTATKEKAVAPKAAAKKEKTAAPKSSANKDTYAIIQTGGKQYRVSQDDVIDVELLHQEPGSKVEFKEVLFINDGAVRVGEPTVGGSIVRGEVLSEVVGPKVVSLKYRPSHHSQTKWGHRQHYSRVKITEIAVG